MNKDFRMAERMFTKMLRSVKKYKKLDIRKTDVVVLQFLSIHKTGWEFKQHVETPNENSIKNHPPHFRSSFPLV
jgi:hypothetical protein